MSGSTPGAETLDKPEIPQSAAHNGTEWKGLLAGAPVLYVLYKTNLVFIAGRSDGLFSTGYRDTTATHSPVSAIWVVDIDVPEQSLVTRDIPYH